MGNYLFNTIDNNTIDKTSAATIITSLSTKYNQTRENKISINNSKSECGHGAIFIGKLKEDSSNLRMLVGRTCTNKIGVFGGGNESGENIIDTVIRESIEEIFNLIPTKQTIYSIKNYLNSNTHLYFIFQIKNSSRAYSYMFDVDILGVFERFISNSGFNLISFIIARKNNTEGTKRKGLNEIKYLSFASLHKLVEGGDKYAIYNFKTKTREPLYYQEIFKALLQTDIIKEIL
jgi:hypothetical protein